MSDILVSLNNTGDLIDKYIKYSTENMRGIQHVNTLCGAAEKWRRKNRVTLTVLLFKQNGVLETKHRLSISVW